MHWNLIYKLFSSLDVFLPTKQSEAPYKIVFRLEFTVYHASTIVYNLQMSSADNKKYFKKTKQFLGTILQDLDLLVSNNHFYLLYPFINSYLLNCMINVKRNTHDTFIMLENVEGIINWET